MPGLAAQSCASFVRKTYAIADMEVRKLLHDPTELGTRAIQPALWLMVFGQVMARARVLESGNVPYLDFLVPGILAQSVLFVSIFNGISVIWERDLGIVHKFLASPTPRAALVLGKGIAGGVRALTQAAVVLLLAAVLGAKLQWSVLSLAGVLLLTVLGALLFSTFSLIIACLVKTRERFMGVGQVLTMPLFFASSAIYPASIMPHWLQVLVHFNPLTYQIDGLRAFLLADSAVSPLGIATDLLVMGATLVALVTICARTYPNIVR